MTQSIFTKEAAEYARHCLEFITKAMPAATRDGTHASTKVIDNFIKAAEDAAPNETD